MLNQEGATVHIHTDTAVMKVNKPKGRRDHDEWHDASIPNLGDEDEMERDQNSWCEACLGEQAFWLVDAQKCDVLAWKQLWVSVGSWHEQESRLESPLITSMVLI